jgi:hypothetical protein
VIRNHDWYNLNSTRHYPLDDNATGATNSGLPLPNNILADCHIRLPRVVGKYLYVSSINITENLASVTFLAAESTTAEKNGESLVSSFTPVAAVSVINPEEFRSYAIEALYPGVGGWIVFGGGIKEVYNGSFYTPEQTLLAPVAARWYDALPIPTAKKEHIVESLTGLITLRGSNTVSVTHGVRQVLPDVSVDGVGDNGERDCIVIGVRDDLAVTNLLQNLAGTCGKRPESGTCDVTPIQFINTVDPDCNGNIDIRFIGELTDDYSYGDSSGLIHGQEINFGLGIADACVGVEDCLPDSEGRLCNDYRDLCEVTSSSQSLSSSSSSSSSSLSVSSSSCGGVLPYGISFDSGTAPDFYVKHGGWGFKDLSPPGSRSSSSWGSSPSSSSSWSVGWGPGESASAESQGHGIIIPGADIAYYPTNQTERNVSIWEGCEYEALHGLPYVDFSRQRRVWADIYIPDQATAGVVLNYRLSPYTGTPHYIFAGIDTPNSQLLLGRFAGSSWSPILESGTAALNANTWYRLVVHVYGVNQSSTTLKVRVYEINQTLITNWPDEAAITAEVAATSTTPLFGKVIAGTNETYTYAGKAGVFGWTQAGILHDSTGTPDIAYFSHFNFDKDVE